MTVLYVNFVKKKEPICLEKYVDLQLSFNGDYSSLLDNLHTTKSVFKYPTILSKYRKNINPIKAIYYSTQEAIINFEQNRDLYSWIISLFDNDTWYDLLISSIEHDILNINEFILIYKDEPSIYIQTKLIELSNQQKNFKKYLEVFKIIKA